MNSAWQMDSWFSIRVLGDFDFWQVYFRISRRVLTRWVFGQFNRGAAHEPL